MNTYLNYIKTNCIDNKYTTWYIKICQIAISRIPTSSLKDSRIFAKTFLENVEGHHILPKCICVSNTQIKDYHNYAFLSRREHNICHKLLTKMFIDNQIIIKMKYAYTRISSIDKSFNNRALAQSEEHKAKNSSALKKLKWFNDGIVNYRLDINKIDTTNLIVGRLSFYHPKGHKASDETKEKCRIASSGSNNPMYGIPSVNKNKLWYNDGIKNFMLYVNDILIQTLIPGRIKMQIKNPQKHIKCEYCDMQTTAGNIARYHNEKCKFKPQQSYV